jgi:hypothetical protein
MIKPFDIIKTREDPEGIGVFYRVSKRWGDGAKTYTSTIEGYMLVPRNEDIEAGTYSRLKQAGLIQ